MMNLKSIPQNWSVRRIKEVGRIKYGLSQPPQYLEHGIPLIRATNIERGKIVEKGLVYIRPDDVPYERNPILKTNDIVVVRSGAYTADSAIVTEIYNGAIIGFDLVIRPDQIEPKYLAYTLLSNYVLRDQLILSSFRAAQPHLNKEELGTALIFYPPLSEQKTIADYLDTKTTQIDRKIDLLNQKATQYGKLKQSLINETVTHGLDKTVVMKDSGVEWIGEVPEHWEVQRMNDISNQNKDKNEGILEKNLLSLSYGKIKRKDFETSYGLLPDSFETYQIVNAGNIILRLTDLQNDKKSLRVGIVKERGIITSAYLGLKFSNITCAVFAYYLLFVYDISKVFYWYGGGLRQSMKFDDIKILPFIVPPYSEQKAIADYLDTKTAHIDRIIETINAQIDKLRELRKTLINDAVTGNIKLNKRHLVKGSLL